ncbi:hypothetical protein ACTXT7_008509 [Hymenolepis weldensis]
MNFPVPKGRIWDIVHQDLGNKSHTFLVEDTRVHADADAYLVTIQTIAVKPPWIDSVANGRANIFQLDSAPSHKALKIQDCMNGREFSLSCHIKLMPAS